MDPVVVPNLASIPRDANSDRGPVLFLCSCNDIATELEFKGAFHFGNQLKGCEESLKDDGWVFGLF